MILILYSSREKIRQKLINYQKNQYFAYCTLVYIDQALVCEPVWFPYMYDKSDTRVSRINANPSTGIKTTPDSERGSINNKTHLTPTAKGGHWSPLTVTHSSDFLSHQNGPIIYRKEKAAER